MKKHNLFLLECIFALLFFALAAAVCAQLFGKSYQFRHDAQSLDRSVSVAQSAAETFRASGGDLEATANSLGAETDGNTLSLWVDKNGVVTDENSGIFLLTLTRREESGVAYGDIEVICEGQSLYNIEAAFALTKGGAAP